MDEAMGRRPSITPPVTIDSSSQDVVVASPPSPREPQTEGETPSKRRREPEWVQILKQCRDGSTRSRNLCCQSVPQMVWSSRWFGWSSTSSSPWTAPSSSSTSDSTKSPFVIERLWRKAHVDTTSGTNVDFTYRKRESLEEDAAPPGLHHSDSPLHHTSGLGMMPVISPLDWAPHRLPVWGHEADGCRQAWISSISNEAPARRRVELLYINGAPTQDPSIMDRTRWLDSYVGPINAAGHSTEVTGASQPGKAFPDPLQLICGREMDHPFKDGHDAARDPMDNIMDRGDGDVKGLGHHTIRSGTGQPI
ncbi:uncharacterized protein LOC119491609 [Sebastes umbrosus]|uniref:uncharacterized protein LOC119491609 n=1 Tax=Sebastes umbrosus TaxID=72105 RepID=UPI00189CA82C|nr:uncharacterized protein LOC119491609 [Sebastes umbrosus]